VERIITSLDLDLIYSLGITTRLALRLLSIYSIIHWTLRVMTRTHTFINSALAF
jgi:hypothetical protein